MNAMKNTFIAKCVMACAGALITTQALAINVYLKAGAVTNTLPNGGGDILMWGFGTNDGPITVPGPVITVPPGDTTLRIFLTNTLPEPVSIVIPGQYGVGQTGTVVNPVRNLDGRVRSFTQETPSNGTNSYLWTNFRPGTYLYHSGTHPAVQIQMGLYGAAKKDYQAGQAYAGQAYQKEVILLYSEIDPVLHNAISNNTYGTPGGLTSTIDYFPKYYLINGTPYTNGLPTVDAGSLNQRVLMRFLSASLETHVPIINGAYFTVIAEDGNAYTYVKQQYSLYLTAGKTLDAILLPPTGNALYALYDRRLSLMNSTNALPGGMLTFLAVGPAAILGQGVTIPDSWIQKYFGGQVQAFSTSSAEDQLAFASADPDRDGVNNIHEYIADTDPTSPLSFLRVIDLSTSAEHQGKLITFGETSADRTYTLQYRTDLVAGEWADLNANVPGQPGRMYILDKQAYSGPVYYRVKVNLP